MRIISFNLNGIRSAARKGFFEWLMLQNADIVCLQEIKAQASDMTEQMLSPPGYHGYYNYAETKGYSGVALYCRQKPLCVQRGFGNAEFDVEGRYIMADFAGFSVVSLYLPSGSSGEKRQKAKFRFMEPFLVHLREWRANGRELIICGDWNIAHKEIDLKNWRGNKKNSGFLPEERAWLSTILNDVGFIDVFRQVHPELEAYTWWSNRGQARAKDVGWRIDYQISTPGMAARACAATIFKEPRFSDHAPLVIDYS